MTAPAGGRPISWDTTSIVVFRALQGAGAALMMPVSATIVMAAFPATERGKVMAIYAGISQVFLALGPLEGGLPAQRPRRPRDPRAGGRRQGREPGSWCDSSVPRTR